jgi:transcriptional regulator with PAS, ATPase and Fis domain
MQMFGGMPCIEKESLMGVVLDFITQSLASAEFLLLTMFIALAAKIYFVGFLLPSGLRRSSLQIPWFLLLGIMVGAMVNDLTWITKLIHRVFFTPTDFSFVITIIRVDWAIRMLQYQFFALFLASLTEKKFKLTFFHTIQLIISGAYAFYFLYFAFFDDTLIDIATQERVQTLGVLSPLELLIMRYAMLYMCTILILPSLVIAAKKMRSDELPHLLRKQLRIFITLLLLPFLLIEFFQMSYFSFHSFRSYFYPVLSTSTLILLVIMYYCIKKVLAYRFLNVTIIEPSYNTLVFIDEFKNTLEALSHATSTQELGHLTQTFFKEAFSIPLRKVTFYARPSPSEKKQESSLAEHHTTVEALVESYMSTHDTSVCDFISKQKILVYDELAFSNFYEESVIKKSIIAFLESINATIFLPIYTKQHLSAYIIVEHHDQSRLYNKMEFDQMLIFASYLGTSISLIRNKNFETMLLQEKELREELYSKHQEINQYKESLQSFLRTAKQNQVGVLFYKNRQFVFGNQAAKELIRINVNQEEGHPLSRLLKKLAQQVESYKAPHATITHDVVGNKIMLAATPNLEHQTVLITIHYPDITDIIAQKNALLHDQSCWDYLLYLETTQAGKLIENLMPGSGETVLNFKIDLLKASLSKKAILIEAPEDDLVPLVELIHHISMREILHVLTLHGQEYRFEAAIKLFGINPLFSVKPTPEPLLKKLQSSGTLFIKNIQFLSLETQEYLADYIRSGFYRAFKSDQKMTSGARIICSTNHNLNLGVQEETFSPTLLNAFKKPLLSMPSLMTLAEQEFNELIDGFAHQAIKTEAFKNLLDLTDKEKNKLVLNRPASLHELKTRVQQLLLHKSKKHHIQNDARFDPAYEITDPELIEAVRLGKHALRDPKIMRLLWHKFKNQNKIALFLGVNRSSVNRRCKEYNLM